MEKSAKRRDACAVFHGGIVEISDDRADFVVFRGYGSVPDTISDFAAAISRDAARAVAVTDERSLVFAFCDFSGFAIGDHAAVVLRGAEEGFARRKVADRALSGFRDHADVTAPFATAVANGKVRDGRILNETKEPDVISARSV